MILGVIITEPELGRRGSELGRRGSELGRRGSPKLNTVMPPPTRRPLAAMVIPVGRYKCKCKCIYKEKLMLALVLDHIRLVCTVSTRP